MMIKNNITGETYKKFVEHAQKKCDAVMFVFNRNGFDTSTIKKLDFNFNCLKENLKNYLMDIRHTPKWGFHESFYISGRYTKDEFLNLFEVMFYKFTDEVRDYLLSNSDMNSWLNPKYPEDMTFLTNGNNYMWSITHEEMCDICCESEEEYEYLKSIGIEFVSDHYEPIDPEVDLFYEEY